MNSIVDVLCSSYQDALNASKAGITRIELCSAPSLKGVTPSLANLQLIKQNLNIEVMCTLRPRPGGFHYDDLDKEAMFLDAKILLDNGADGLVFGILTSDSHIDVEATKALVDLIHSYNKKAICNRAIDVCKDIYAEVETLVNLGVDSVITSGGYIKAVEGIEVIKKLHDAYGDKIDIIAGCGVDESNAQYILDNTSITHIHYSSRSTRRDATTSRYGVNFSYVGTNCYEVVEEEDIKNLLNSMK